jgi:flavin reductase (DIM6/NTAB) family NADH-FMN oxidoreductase RutF
VSAVSATQRTPAQDTDLRYRAFMSGFPSGVTVVTAVARDGRPRGLTCTSMASVSLRPPTLLVCIDVRSGTLAALAATGRFGVNLLHAGGRRAAEVFATRDADRFAMVRWRPSTDLGLPWLVDDAAALAQCSVTDLRTVGDHTVVFGLVRDIVLAGQRTPLLYGLRQFTSWSAPAPAAAGADRA